MIKTFRNKALRRFWETTETRKLPVENARRVLLVLQALDTAKTPEDMNKPGLKFHGLHADPKRWSVWITGNYRITFAWDDGAIDVDIEDYHG